MLCRHFNDVDGFHAGSVRQGCQEWLLVVSGFPPLRTMCCVCHMYSYESSHTNKLICTYVTTSVKFNNYHMYSLPPADLYGFHSRNVN